MNRKKHPSDSNSFKQRRHRRAKRLWLQHKDLIGQNMNTEGTSFSDFCKKIQNVNEAANIRSYPTQALGRKRNMFLKAMALDDNKFREWVQNRLYRLAYDNKRSITDFTPRDIAMGLQKWEGLLRNSDPGFGKYDTQFKQYTDRFLKVATALIGNTTSGQGTKGVEPHEAPSLSPASEPVSPTMMNYQVSSPKQVQNQPVQSQDMENIPQEEIGPAPEEQQFMDVIQQIQDAMSMKDKDFMNYAENQLMERGIDVETSNPAEIDQAMDEEFQQILDSIPEGSPYYEQEQEIEELFAAYKQRFLELFSKMQGKLIGKLDKADQVNSKRLEKIKKDPSLFEVGIVVSSAVANGVPLEQTGVTELEMNKLQKDPITYTSTKRLVTNLFQAYPQLAKGIPYWMGRETNPSELSETWSGSDGTSVSDIVFDFGEKRMKFKNEKFVGCGKDSKEDACISQVKVAIKINETNIVPKNPKDSNAIFDSVVEYFRTKDYDFSSDSALYQRLLADGIQPEQARIMAQEIVEQVKIAKMDLQNILQSPDIRRDMKFFLSEMAVKTKTIVDILPGFKKEYIYCALTGEGRFKEGSMREANFILSSDETGERVVFVPIDRNLAEQIGNESQFSINVVAPKVSKTDPLIKKYTDMGMSKEEAQQKISLDYPYRLNQLLDVIEQANANSMMMDPNMAGTILPESSVLYTFMSNMRQLKEDLGLPQPIMDPESTEYINAAFEYAFESFTNMVRFFGFEFKDAASTELNLYNMFYAQQPYDMGASLNNRINMNNELGDEMIQNRLENGVQNKWFEYKQKERPTV